MRKNICVILVLAMLVQFLPAITPQTDAATEDIGSMNALQALGIDTSVMPEGFDERSTDNPYGRDTVTVNPVYEFYSRNGVGAPLDNPVEFGLQTVLSGHNRPLNRGWREFYANQVFHESVLTATPARAATLAATASASGNFVGAAEAGKAAQVVTVGAGSLDERGGLYLYFNDPLTGAISGTIELIATTAIIGNSGRQMDEDFGRDPYLMQNYLQITTGDFDKDGIDEVAVYVPEQGRSRVEFFKLQLATGATADAYLDEDNWQRAWTYFFNESPYVSNMVSLTAGDFNRDGTDDIALTWGFYYGPDNHNAGQAVILYGSNTNMLQVKKPVDLLHGTAGIVRAAFDYGDIDGDNVNDLILGGQLSTDIAGGNINSRFLAIYNYDGRNDRFNVAAARNFNLFEKQNDLYVHAAMAERDGRFFSMPAANTNLAAVNMNGMGHAAYVYLDSLLIEHGAKGLVIKKALDNDNSFNKNVDVVQGQPYYIEYGVVAADFDGDGKESLKLMQYYPGIVLFPGGIPEALRWWYSFIMDYFAQAMPQDELNMLSVYSGSAGIAVERSPRLNFTVSFCKLKTDNDTMLLKSQNIRYVTYSDPKILAVMASPPYFAALDNDALSGSYMDSETAYSSTRGAGVGGLATATVSVGSYIGFEYEFEQFGVRAGKAEAEVAVKANFTYDMQAMSMLEQTITYATPAGTDAVAFFSIPLETHVFHAYIPILDSAGNVLRYDVQDMTVNIPHTAAVRVLPLETYERIAADFDELPQISGSVLTHTVGDPASYPSSSAGFSNVIEFDGDWSAVGYGGGSITQEINMTHEVGHSFTWTVSVEAKIGGGPGNVVAGVTAGVEAGGGFATITTTGSTFSGTLHNMPIEAEPYGYGFAWRLFSYLYSERGISFPVVSYLVRDVVSPPPLPADFQQDTAGTTANQIMLTWSYSGAVAGFQLYRYYLFPDGSGSYELAFVPASDAVRSDPVTGTRYFEFIDTGLDTYAIYKYQIQVIGASVPPKSILSPVLTARTKSDIGYPSVSLTGVTDGRLKVFPDASSTVSVIINNRSDYTQTPRYQWQKQVDGAWRDIPGAINASYTFRSAGIADEGLYRCRINVIYQGRFISAFSDTFRLEYSKRTPMVVPDSFTVRDVTSGSVTVPSISISLQSAHPGHFSVPSGNVTFSITGADFSSAFTVPLAPSGVPGVAIATHTPDRPLPDGAYEISAFYSGSRVFKSLTTEHPIPYLSGISDGFVLTLDSIYTYGDIISPTLKILAKTGGVTSSSPVTGNVTFKIYEHGTRLESGRLVPYLFENNSLLYGGGVRAAQTGTFSLAALVNNVKVAQRSFSVTRKNITIGIENQQGVAGIDIVHPDHRILRLAGSSTLAFDDTIAGLGLRIKATNTAGTEVTLGNDTLPGYYRIIGAAGETAGTKFQNYAITFVPGTYILTGMRYSVTGVANKLLNKIVGSIELVTPEGDINASPPLRYPSGTSLVFRARPHAGYSVKNWTITNSMGDILSTGTSSMTMTHQMRAEDITVEVDFQVAQNRLWYLPIQEDTGTVVCISNTVMRSGDVAKTGAEFTFKASPAPGYHFAGWQLIETGRSPVKSEGVLHPDGSSTIMITMGTGPTWLYAIFVRDSYTLTLEGDLQASYMDDTDNNTMTPDELVTVHSGARIMGDTEVTVSAKPGFSVVQAAAWTKNGQPLTAGISSDNQSYTFKMQQDTKLSVSTQNVPFAITLQVTGPGIQVNIVSVTVNGVAAANLNNVAGGSAVEFRAVPAYGYLFDKWIVNGEVSSTAGSSLLIAALGGNLHVEAVFKNNIAYTVSVTHGLRGKLSYSLNGGASTSISSGGSIPVFKGDNLIITAQPEANFMVENWNVDGNIWQTTNRTRTFSNISADIAVSVVFGAQSYATVTYAVDGQGGTIVSATTDGISFASGNNSIGNGSTLVFTAEPVSGMMIDQWKHNGVLVKNENGSPLVETTFTIPALAGDADILVSFRVIETHTVTIVDQNTNTTIEAEYIPDIVAGGVRDGAKAIFTVTPAEGYAVTSVSAETTSAGVDVPFASISRNEDGSWICIINAVTDDLTVTAEAAQLYAISIPIVPDGGSIMLSAEKAIAGTRILLTATPRSSHAFSRWTVLVKNSGEPVAVTNNTAVSTSFTMPAADVTVAAAFTNIGGGGGGGDVIGGGGGGGVIGGGGGGGGGAAGPIPGPVTAPITGPVSPPRRPLGISVHVIAAVGALLTFEDIIVEIPANALPGDATFQINRISDDEGLALIPAGMRIKIGSDIYEITTSGTRDFGSGFITIAIAYTPGAIANNEVPVIHYYDEAAKLWRPIITERIERNGKWYAAVEVNHLTKFAVFSGRNQVSRVISLTLGRADAVVNGKNYLLDTKPFVDNFARTLVPLRFIGEALGAAVLWDRQTRTATIREEGITLILTLDSKNVRLNGKTGVMDSMPVLRPPGRILVPLRFISENLGATVNFNQRTREIQIRRAH